MRTSSTRELENCKLHDIVLFSATHIGRHVNHLILCRYCRVNEKVEDIRKQYDEVIHHPSVK